MAAAFPRPFDGVPHHRLADAARAQIAVDPDALDLQPGAAPMAQVADSAELHAADHLALLDGHHQLLVGIGIDLCERLEVVGRGRIPDLLP